MMESKRESEKENKRENKTEDRAGFGGPLYRKLREYGESDYYGFHMPGHKRQLGYFENPYKFDITEIDGFDDLHHPEKDGVLTRAQERAAGLYGAEETHFLVGGSTAGILSAISGCARRGGRILMARNCHRSVYHAAELGGLEAEYLYPQQIASPGINGPVLPEDVERALAEKAAFSEQEKGQDARKAAGWFQAVVITSPTYDGICSDVRAIAKICHRHEVPLIVDQAHGAHFPFSDYFPEDAVSAGADVVIHSVHKTLPSLTQTALLHIQGRLADRERIRHFLSVYQSSSPSYILMASIDACMELLETKGEALFREHAQLLESFREGCRDLEALRLYGAEQAPHFDRSKLLISTERAEITGGGLSGLLLERYHLQLEMSAPDYAVGIASIADTESGFARLNRALHELDRELAEGSRQGREKEKTWMDAGRLSSGGLPRSRAALTAGEALEREKESRPLSKCAGRLAGAYVYLYPPGIPLLVPGEEITEQAIGRIEKWLAAGFPVHGLAEGKRLLTVRG